MTRWMYDWMMHVFHRVFLLNYLMGCDELAMDEKEANLCCLPAFAYQLIATRVIALDFHFIFMFDFTPFPKITKLVCNFIP